MTKLTAAHNQSATKQLGVAESYTAFTASTSLDLFDDNYQQDLNQLENHGDFSVDDVIHIIEIFLTLPLQITSALLLAIATGVKDSKCNLNGEIEQLSVMTVSMA